MSSLAIVWGPITRSSCFFSPGLGTGSPESQFFGTCHSSSARHAGKLANL